MKRSKLVRFSVYTGLLLGLLSILFVACAKPAPAPAPSPAPAPAPTTVKPAAPAAPIALKLSNPWGPTFPPGLVQHRWADEVTRQTNGRIKVDVYDGGILGGTAAAPALIRAKTADVAAINAGANVGSQPMEEFFTGPFMYKTAKEASIIYAGLWKKGFFDKELAEFKVLSVQWGPPSNLFAIKPIRKLEDMQGLKFRDGGSAMHAAFLKALGTVPVDVPSTDVYQAVQKGIIQGGFFFLPGIVSSKLYEVAKNVTLAPISGGGYAMAMNKDTWASIPADLQAIIEKVNAELPAYHVQIMDTFAEDAIVQLPKLGVDVYTPPKEELARWTALTRPGISEEADRLESKGYPAKKMLEAIAEIAKANGMAPLL